MPSVLASAFAVPAIALLLRNDDAAGAADCFGCFGFIGLLFVGLIVLHVVLFIWVARDAKARSMDSSILWMLLVMVTGLVGLVIYLFARPQGNSIACPSCGNKRLQVSAKCPHCGNV